MTPFEWVYVVGSGAYMVLEYWLGKTDKVAPGSVLEAVVLVGKKLFGKKCEEEKK